MPATLRARAAVARLVYTLCKLHQPTWTREDLAEALQAADALMAARGIGTTRITPHLRHAIRTISTWENGHRLPDDDSWVRLILATAHPDELRTGTVATGSLLSEILNAWEEMEVPMHRRHVLLGLASLAATGRNAFTTPPPPSDRLTWTLQHPERTDLTTVLDLQAGTRELFARSDATPPALLLPDAHRHLGTVAFLHEHARQAAVREELAAALIQARTLTGRLHWNASGRRTWGTPERLYQEAARLAEGSERPALAAYPRICQALIEQFSKHDVAATIREAARAAQLTGPRTLPSLSAWAHAQLGEAHALLGQERESLRALDTARARIEQATPGTDPFYGLYLPEHVESAHAAALLYLGNAAEAERALRGLAGRLAEHPRQLAIVLGERSLALLRSGDPEEGAAALGQAIAVAQRVGGAGGAQRAWTAGRELAARWGREPWARDALEALRALDAPTPRPLGARERAA